MQGLKARAFVLLHLKAPPPPPWVILGPSKSRGLGPNCRWWRQCEEVLRGSEPYSVCSLGLLR